MPKAISSLRIRRLITLLTFLRKHGEQGAEVGTILSHCEYTNCRALQDDIRMLRDEYRADIVFSRVQPCRYCLKSEGDFLLSLSLNEKDIIALVAGLGMTAHFLPSMETNCKALWKKIQEILPEVSVNFGRWLAGTVMMATPVSNMKAEVFDACLNALRQKMSIEVDYISPYKTREVRTHILAPWGVFFRSHAWYLLAGRDPSVQKEQGSDKLKKDIPIVFRLSRVHEVRPCPDVPFFAPPEAYSLEKFAASAWYVSVGELEYDIRLRIVEPMATIVSETIWYSTQKTAWLDENTLELTARVPDLKEVARWVLSSAPYIAVEEPAELRGMVHDWAKQMVELNHLE